MGAICSDGIASPNPDYPQEIKIVKGENRVNVQNKNLFDKNTTVNGYVSDNNGSYHSNNGFYCSDYINIKEFDYITTSCVDGMATGAFYDKDKVFISGLSSTANTSRTTAVPTNAVYLRTGTRYHTDQSLNSFQVEAGQIATSYVPHQEQNYTITLPTGMELCKIGDYQDRIYGTPDNWFLEKKIRKLSLGDYSWLFQENVFKIAVTNCKKSGKVFSNYFISRGLNTDNSIENQYYNYLNLCIRFDKMEGNATNFKNWCIQNNAIAYLVLTEPTTTPITDTTLIQQLNDLYYAKSYQGTTYISVDTENLKPILKVDYKKSNLLRIKALEEANS